MKMILDQVIFIFPSNSNLIRIFFLDKPKGQKKKKQLKGCVFVETHQRKKERKKERKRERESVLFWLCDVVVLMGLK